MFFKKVKCFHPVTCKEFLRNFFQGVGSFAHCRNHHHQVMPCCTSGSTSCLIARTSAVRARRTLMPDLRQRLANHSAAELAAIFEKHGLPFAPISRPEQLLDDPHLNATGGLADITLPDGERAGQTARTTLLPLAMDGQRLGVRLQPPVLGQHTANLMQELGYTPEQVQALQQAGAVA